MPQVDLETLVCGGGGSGGGDGKVSCETLIAAIPVPGPEPDPNLPPESVRIPIEDYSLDLATAAVIYERDDSAKESTNPKSQTHNPNPNPNPNQSRSNSQRYAGATNLKANNGPILGLPNKIKIKHVTCSRTDTNSRIFPKKKPAKPGAKSAVPEYEPSSPKVSCFGKVLSDRERETCRLARRRRQRDSSGCWVGLAALFSCGSGGKERQAIEAVEERVGDVAARGDIFLKRRNIPFDEEEEEGDGNRPMPVAVPGLGEMKRFASGRRASSWGSDVDADADTDGHVPAADLSRRRSLDEAWGVGPTAA